MSSVHGIWCLHEVQTFILNHPTFESSLSIHYWQENKYRYRHFPKFELKCDFDPSVSPRLVKKQMKTALTEDNGHFDF